MSSTRLSAGIAALCLGIALAGCSSTGNHQLEVAAATSPAADYGADAAQVAAEPSSAGSYAGADGTDGSADGYGAAGDYAQADAETPLDGADAEAEPTAAASSPARKTHEPAAGTGHAKPTKAAAAAEPQRYASLLVVVELPGMGSVVTDQKGMILYRFEKDTAKPAASHCVGECAGTWPPVLVKDHMPKLKGVDAHLVGTITRANGTKQVTLHGWPLYYYGKDAEAGLAKGQGMGRTWYAVAKDGSRNDCVQQAAVAARYTKHLVAAHDTTKHSSVVLDQDGRLLYRFDKDTPHPATSTCVGGCAVKWPPALVASPIVVESIDGDLVGAIKRPDGGWQLTLNGWPLYYFAKDSKAGDLKGQGVGGTWFAVTRDGAKNTVLHSMAEMPMATSA